ncbi:aminotransferase A [Bacillaceae bacterium S4-13-58]
MKLINSNVEKIQISGIRQFFNMVADKEDIVSLTIGQPDFNTPQHIKDAANIAIDQNHTSYTHNAGILPLREKVSEYLHEKYNLNYNPSSEIIVTVGASQGIDITFRTLLEPGDEVLLPGPIYPGYEPLIQLAGGTPVFMDTTTTDFQVTPSLIEKYSTDKTKCIVLPYPSNPTGVTLKLDVLKDLASYLQDKNMYILSDEIYSELVYDHDHTSIATFPGMRQKTIVINGLSKSHAMTGWRIGFVCAPDNIAKHLLKVHQYNVSCATSISQYAAYAAVTEGKNDAKPMREAYRQRRKYVADRLTSMGIDFIMPNGAFYFFPKFNVDGMSSFDFGLDLVDKAKLALVPGDAFSPIGQGYMRLSYAYNMDTLSKGMDRLEQYLKS